MKRQFSDHTSGKSQEPRPTPAWLFAQELLGKPVPSAAAADAQARRAHLEWLARISPEHERELRAAQQAQADAQAQRERLEWLALISERHEAELRRLLRAEAEAAQEQSKWQTTESGVCEWWNPADHPRTGTPPNPGWFAQTTGGRSNNYPQQSTHTSAASIELDRVETQIKQRSGNNWEGDRILTVMSAIAPAWVPFVKKRVTLAQTSNRATAASTTIRTGEYGPEFKGIRRAQPRDVGKTTIHFDIPADWNDIQATQYIVRQIADDRGVHRLAAAWATDNPKLFNELRDQRFKNGLPTIAALAGGYYTAIASFGLGGQVAVAAWDIQNGDKLSAALNLAFILPVGKIVKTGADATGTIAIHAGERLVAALPLEFLEQVAKLAPEQEALLNKRLLAATTEQEAVEVVGKFLATKFDKHHPLPKFLGGELDQHLVKIPKDIHVEFHALLREELRAVGFSIPFGSPKGSTRVWEAHFFKYEGSHANALKAILNASRIIDEKHGTSVTEWVWKNIMGKQFIVFP